MTKLKDITGKALSGEWGTDDETGVGIPVLRTTNFTNEGSVNYENVVTRIITKKDISEKYLQSGDIIIEKSGGSDKQPVGRVIYFDGPENTYLFNNFTGLLRVRDKNEWFPRYVFYSLFANYKKGGTRPFENKTTGLHNLKTDDYVSRYEITEIPLNKQVAICAQLDQILKVINLRRKEISNLDDLIKARFVEMFGDNQEVHKLSDIAAITGGLTKNSRRDKLELRKPYLRVANVFFASIDTTEILDIGLTKEEYEKTLLRNGDLLFVEGNGSPDQIGRVAIWNGEIEDCVHQNHLIKARFDLKRMNPVFAMYYFISERGRNQIKKRAVSTSGLYTLSVSKIADFEIPNPPMELQQQFAAFVAAIDKSKATVQKALDETQLLFDSLMQQYFG